MTLDTYLPAGRGRYIVGSAPGSNNSFYYFMPEDRDHVRVGFLITGKGRYAGSEYLDVIVFNPESRYETIEKGEYTITRQGRSYRLVRLSTEHMLRTYMVFEQPKLGRFRFISC